MNATAEFALDATPLGSGITLLEASAGTGKTFTISGIVTRLVAVEGIPISEILVVTFTEAATRELRSRIRERLKVIDVELTENSSKDPVIHALRASGIATAVLQRRLRLATASFDEAAISTIHGFCQQILRDNAFEGDMPFDVEVLTDPSGLQRDLAHDFWQRIVRRSNPVALALADAEDLMPDDLAELLVRLARHPDLVILPTASVALEVCSRALETAAQEALAIWRTHGAALAERLQTHPALRRSDKGLPKVDARDLVRALDDAVAGGVTTPSTVAALRRLSAENIEAYRDKRLKKNPYPDDPFHAACSHFARICGEWSAALRAAWLGFADTEMPKLKAARKVMTFDDMLSRTHDALHGPTGRALVEVIQRRFRAALIDEFQDTDPLQYDIFRTCFAQAPHRLMLIGDPKQAIYGFRGADLYTYLGARADVLQTTGQSFTLRRNYRSAEPLVEAVNAIFGKTPGCFLQGDIDFTPAIADGTRAAKTPLVSRDGAASAPLTIVSLQVDEGEDALNADRARRCIARDMASEILTLLDGRYNLGDRPLVASDIAILVRSHRDAEAIQTVLRAAGITSVRRTNESVFHTHEASELGRILEGVLEPSRDRLLKTALSTSIFGLSANDLLALDADETTRASWVQRLTAIRDRWLQRGFASAFRALLVNFEVRQRLVALQDGERKLTNFLHLAELAHRAEREQRLAPSAVLQWIRTEQGSSATGIDEFMQRLERDEDAVRIVTVHNSKGLEYPIVFCPSHWGAPNTKEVLFHDPANDFRLTLNLSSPAPDAHRELSTLDRYAEDVRLLYVSLTRASHRCYLYLHKSKRSPRSALTEVLGSDLIAAGTALATDHPTCITLRSPIDHLGSTARPRSAPAEATTLTAREVSRRQSSDPLIASFSRLVADAAEEDAQDHDAIVDPSPESTSLSEVAAAAPIFRLPAGAATGVALHAVLEHLDFTQPDNLSALVGEHFSPLRLDDEMLAAVSRQLEVLLQHPLAADDQVVKLADVSPQDRQNEAEFYYPIQPFTPAELAAACQMDPTSLLPKRIGRLRFDPVDGFLRGFIDLIFRHDGRYYLLDWKSNRLGEQTIDYAPQRLERVMNEHFYHLQSWLYTVALDRHLANSLVDYRYDEHFGGVFYIFVRGIDPASPDRGVHFARPSQEFIRRLGDTLFGARGKRR